MNKTPSLRRRLAVLLAGATVLSGLVSFVPAQSASALGCVLGPSLASAAKAAGVSCPDVEGGGGGGEHWGAAGGACAFGWGNGQIPPGMLDFLNGSYVMSDDYILDSGERATRTTFMRGGKTVGQVNIRSRGGRFVMGINVYERGGLKQEFAYFDCMESSDGAMYKATPYSSLIPMPASGSTTVPAEVKGSVQTRGAMSALPDGKNLLRVDVTNTGKASTFADVFLGLNGYSVESFALLPRVVDCQPYEGLFCTIDGVLPGQTVSMILVVTAGGDPDAAAVIDVDVAAMGLVEIKSSISRPAVNHPAVVTDFYEIRRP
jgi:hypothetical protein